MLGPHYCTSIHICQHSQVGKVQGAMQFGFLFYPTRTVLAITSICGSNTSFELEAEVALKYGWDDAFHCRKPHQEDTGAARGGVLAMGFPWSGF